MLVLLLQREWHCNRCQIRAVGYRRTVVLSCLTYGVVCVWLSLSETEAVIPQNGNLKKDRVLSVKWYFRLSTFFKLERKYGNFPLFWEYKW